MGCWLLVVSSGCYLLPSALRIPILRAHGRQGEQGERRMSNLEAMCLMPINLKLNN